MYVSNEYLNKGLHRVVDTDFVDTIELPFPLTGWEAIIRVYEKRKLNVAGNLFRAIVEYSKHRSGGATIDDVIRAMESKDEQRINPSFHKYRDELKKYLMLM